MTDDMEENDKIGTEPSAQSDGKVRRISNLSKQEDLNLTEIDGEDVILFVEYKYCTVCHIE